MRNEKNNRKYFCDICGKEAKDIKHLIYPVIFQTEQTEGRNVEPYIYNTNIDVCPNCCKKILKLSATGAQGYNSYSIIDWSNENDR